MADFRSSIVAPQAQIQTLFLQSTDIRASSNQKEFSDGKPNRTQKCEKHTLRSAAGVGEGRGVPTGGGGGRRGGSGSARVSGDGERKEGKTACRLVLGTEKLVKCEFHGSSNLIT